MSQSSSGNARSTGGGRRWRWAAEGGVLIIVLPFVLAVLNDQRTCTSPQFGLPQNCDTGWITATVLLLAVITVLLELGLAARRRARSRPCPRCGERVPVGRLDCRACKFDFRSVGA